MGGGSHMSVEEWERTKDARIRLVRTWGSLAWGRLTVAQCDEACRIATDQGFDKANEYVRPLDDANWGRKAGG